MNTSKTIGIGAIVLTVLAIIVVVFSMISAPAPVVPTPAPSNTPRPTATHDPCSTQNLAETVDNFDDLSHEFDDYIKIAQGTPNAQLSPIIADLQRNRRIVEDRQVPGCIESLKANLVGYMDAYIETYLARYSSTNAPLFQGMSQKQYDEVMAPYATLFNQNYQRAIDFANKYVQEKALLLGQTPPPLLGPEGAPGTPPAELPTVAPDAGTPSPAAGTLVAPT